MENQSIKKNILITAIPVVFALILSVLALLMYGTGEDGIRHFNRYTARISFSIFIVIFALPGIKFLFREKFYHRIEQNQRYLMLAMLIIMLIHLGGIYYIYQILPEMPVKLSTFAGGGLAYLMIFLLFILGRDGKNNESKGKIWSFAMSFGLYWIWFIFAFTYIGRLSRSMMFMPLTIFTFALLFFRIWGILKIKRFP